MLGINAMRGDQRCHRLITALNIFPVYTKPQYSHQLTVDNALSTPRVLGLIYLDENQYFGGYYVSSFSNVASINLSLRPFLDATFAFLKTLFSTKFIR